MRKSRPIDGLYGMMPYPPTLGVEVGVYAGVMAERMLKAWPSLHLHLVDPWEVVDPDSEYAATGDPTTTRTAMEWERVQAECLDRVRPFLGRVTIHKAYDAAVVDGYADESLDFVYIDSDHSYMGCTAAIERWHPKVKPGGLVSGHDYKDYDRMRLGVIEAVNNWTRRNGYDLILGEGTVWGYIRP